MSMQKSLYFISPTQPHFIEVNNKSEVKNTYHVYFTGDNLNLFKLENYNVSTFPNFNTSYTIEVGANSSAYLEISPICGDVSVDAHIYCNIVRSDEQFSESYRLVLALRKEDYSRNITRYSNLPKTFNQYSKNEESTFALLHSNPLLSGNTRLLVDSKGNMKFTLTEGLVESNNSKLFNRTINKGSDYLKTISSFFQDLNKEKDNFYNYYSNIDYNTSNTVNKLSEQYTDDVYASGVSYYPSKYNDEKYSIFAPLYLEDKVPSKFVIFKRTKFQDIDKKDIFKDLEIVKVYDLTKTTELGKYLDRTITSANFNKSHIKTNITSNSVLAEITGIDPKSSAINTVYEDLTPFISNESTLIDFERFVTETYYRRSMVSHKIINLEFLFDDDSTGINSYFGMYVDDLELSNFELDGSVYGDDIYQRSRLNNNEAFTTIHTKSTLQLDNKYVNTNDRLFYFKYGSNYKNILNTTLSNGKLSVDIDSEVKLKDLLCDEHIIDMNSVNILDSSKTYLLLDFTNNILPGGRVIIDGVKDYIFEVVDDVVSDISVEYVGYQSSQAATVIDDSLYVSKYFELPDDIPIKLYNNSTYLGEFPLGYSVNQGNSTILYFSDAVDLSSVTHIDFNLNDTCVYKVKYDNNFNNVVAQMVTIINRIDIPYTASQKGNQLAICNNFNTKFTVRVDYSKSDNILNTDVQYFNKAISVNSYTIGNEKYSSNVHTFTSTTPLRNNEVYYEIDNYNSSIINSSYFGNDKSSTVRVEPIVDDNYSIKYWDFTKDVIKVTRNVADRKLFKPCPLSIGIFSIYDTKDFDTDRISQMFDFIDEEYRLIYRNFVPDEKLVPRMRYEILNTGTQDIVISIKYGIEDSWNHTELKRISVSPGSSAEFSTYASDYGLNHYGENIEFRYDLIEGSNGLYTVSNKHIFDDPDLRDVNFEFPYSAFMDSNLQRYIQNARDSKQSYFPYLKNSRSEYLRLQEFSQETSKLEDMIVPKYLKWGSKSMDSKNQNMRLNFSPVFGKTGYTSYLSNYAAVSSLHSHEWFILEEPPSHIKLYEGVEGQYLFTQVSKSMLLDKTYDYFTEYFDNGWGNVFKGTSPVKLTRKRNYSTLSREGEGVYSTFFKGVNYRFNSAVNLNDYKFAVSVSTRPELEELNGSLIDHCEVVGVDDNCKAAGIFPILMDAIDVLNGSTQNLSIKVSVINAGTTISINDDSYITTSINSTIYDTNDFYQELDLALDKWEAEIERTYSTTNNWKNNLNIVFSENPETGNFPVTASYVTESQMEDYKIGNIRIGFADLQGGDIAKTYFVTREDYLETTELMTPVILLNSRVFFRKNSDVSSTDAYSLAYVIAHELGHVFGLGHTFKKDSIMDPVVKINYNLSDLDQRSTQECLELIYGKYVEDAIKDTTSTFSCSKTRTRKHDTFEYIINETFKTITLRICVDIPNYLSLDGKSSYVNMYVSNSLKRIAGYNDTYTLEGLDLKIPSIDLSVHSLSVLENVYYTHTQNNMYSRLNEYNVGYNPLQSAYRIRRLGDTKENYQFDYFTFDYINDVNKYRIQSSFNGLGDVNKPLLQKVHIHADSTDNTPLPLLSKSKFINSFSYRIGGGDSIENGNYKLSLDYLSEFTNKFTYTYSSNSDKKRDFEVSILPIKKVRIGEMKIPVRNNDVKLPQYVLNTEGDVGELYRYEGEYDPLMDEISYFGLREDYELSNLLGIDLYRCNTKILWEHPNFGLYNRIVKKTSLQNLTEDGDDVRFSLYGKELPVYNNARRIYDSPIDKDMYRLYWNENRNQNLSGFYDPILYKSNLNSILLQMPDVFDQSITSGYVTFEYNSNKEMSVEFNTRTILTDILYEYISPYYSDIYNMDDSEYKNSLENFIYNNFLNLYNIEKIELYLSDNANSVYVDTTTGLSINSGFSIENKNDSITILHKTLNKNSKVHVKIKFKFI